MPRINSLPPAPAHAGASPKPLVNPASPQLSQFGARRQTWNRTLRAWGTYAVFLTLYAFVFSFWQIEPVPLEVHALGIVIAALCLFPLALWGARGSHGVPMFELICIAYLLAFGVPIYTQENGMVILSRFQPYAWEQTQIAVQMAAVGIACLIAGYYAARPSALVRAMPRVDLPLRPFWRSKFIAAALAVGLGTIALNVLQPSDGGGAFASFERVLQNQAYIALVLLAYDAFRARDPRRALWLYAAAGALALLGMLTGMLENVLVPLVLVFVVRWHVARRMPVAWLAGGIVLLVILNSVKHEFRQAAWYSGEQLSAGQKAGLWLGLGGQAAQEGVGENGGSSEMLRSTLSRFDLLHQFVRITDMTPQSVPYYEGYTYEYLLYGWIPRVLWPDKPTAQIANVLLSVDYKFITQEQTAGTMIGIGHLPEAYANFGLWGIVIAMSLQGALFALVDRVLNSPASDGGRAIYLTVMVFFLNGIGSSTATHFMAIAPNVVASALILRLFTVRTSARRGRNKRSQRAFRGGYASQAVSRPIL